MTAAWGLALAIGLAVAVAPARADDPVTPTPAALGWPDPVAALEVIATTHVRAAASSTAPVVGKIVGGTVVAWTALAAGDRACPAWVAIAPTGWVCATAVAPAAVAPAGVDYPSVAPGALLPGDYFQVTWDDTPAYSTAAAIRAGEPRALLPARVMVRSRGTVELDGLDYLQTGKGLVPASEVAPLAPSTFAGIAVSATAGPWPLAFVAPHHPAIVRAAPAADAARIDQRAPRAVVAVGREQGGWIEIAPDAWIAAAALRVVRPAPPPVGLDGAARWIDVDLEEQVLVAYEGARPVFATLVSTGRKAGTTPVGVYRIRAKAAVTGMASEAGARATYDVGAVPWALRFRRGLFLHAAYWHDGFGDRRSHGCINLAPRDARHLYAWVTPAVPPGWSELEIAIPDGVVVRVRDRDHPDPPWFDYADEERPPRGRKRPRVRRPR